MQEPLSKYTIEAQKKPNLFLQAGIKTKMTAKITFTKLKAKFHPCPHTKAKAWILFYLCTEQCLSCYWHSYFLPWMNECILITWTILLPFHNMKMLEFQGQNLRGCYEKAEIVVLIYKKGEGRGKRMSWTHTIIRILNSSPFVMSSGWGTGWKLVSDSLSLESGKRLRGLKDKGRQKDLN